MPELIAVALDLDDYTDVLRRRFADLLVLPAGEWGAATPGLDRVDVLVTDGTHGAGAREMDLLPALRLIACIGTGHENIDVAEARRRGIALSYGAGANAETVADHAMALLLCSLRRIAELDRELRLGGWRGRTLYPSLHGKKLGLLGYGGIGQAIARRGLGFGMSIGYFARSARPGLPGRHHASALDLAAESDVVVSALPGGAATLHLVDRAFLRALGPGGHLVNVGRGSVVSSADLAAALSAGEIAGAALDVFETEPDIPPVLLSCPNLIMTPHVGGASPEARTTSHQRLLDNILAVRAGRPPVTPVP